ncbi:MAG: DUF2520 domain-containing protein [Gemmatimonadota bacterium]|nr:DUF2520 domain-containing protein [Gemmatimonadota bacterium]MDH5758164.1 DUF2520 domain-containing protein [Gemmatimonadota bacterium]
MNGNREGIVIVGPGRMGLALGYALSGSSAVSRITVCGRAMEPPHHPLFTEGAVEYSPGLRIPFEDTEAVFLAVPDHVVPELAHTLAGLGDAPPGCVAFHLSGALSTEVLAPLHHRGYAVGSFHPLQAVSLSVGSARRLRGAWFGITGGPEAMSVARRLVTALEGAVLSVPESRKAVYHAAAVMASNFLPPLLDAACRMLERAGVSHEDALPALLPLVEGALANVRELGVQGAVTGPVARGDLETVGLHLRAMEPDERFLYTVLACELIQILGEALSDDARAALMDVFQHELE